MTEELFVEDSYLREFEARIVELSGREVILDRTVSGMGLSRTWTTSPPSRRASTTLARTGPIPRAPLSGDWPPPPG